MYSDPDTGTSLNYYVRKIQNDLLPTMDTEFIKVNYRIEVVLKHEGNYENIQEVPSLFFPCIITKDAKGEIDTRRNDQINKID